MTPAARIAAAIGILDAIEDGQPAEQALTRWSRQSRFAGSGDRAAIRDHVFDVLRQRDTVACLGGGYTGRALAAGLLRLNGEDPATCFTGEGHAPPPLSDAERTALSNRADCADLWNLPDWMVPEFTRSLSAPKRTATALQERAPVTLRVNKRKATRAEARQRLSAEGIESVENPLCENAITVTDGARRLRNSDAYREGLVELQDAASQAVVALVPAGRKCLDYCAGGGGKALALAVEDNREVFAHDIDPNRMKDIPARAERAGTPISRVHSADLDGMAPFDIVLCDAPCSGSGAWRRSPEAKWSFTQSDLQHLCQRQDGILDAAARLVGSAGTLVYVTCSVLRTENEDRIAAFLSRVPGWSCPFEHRFDVTEYGDGFFCAHLTRVFD